MPDLARITATFFVNLINRLGVRPPPADGFLLSNVVQPVSIVDSDITLSAVVTTVLQDTPFTTGPQLSPAANTVLADTGALSAGTYQVRILASQDMAVANGVGSMKMQRRDSANAANIWEQSLATGQQGTCVVDLSMRIVLSTSERLRILSNVTSAGVTVQASIWAVAS